MKTYFRKTWDEGVNELNLVSVENVSIGSLPLERPLKKSALHMGYEDFGDCFL